MAKSMTSLATETSASQIFASAFIFCDVLFMSPISFFVLVWVDILSAIQALTSGITQDEPKT